MELRPGAAFAGHRLILQLGRGGQGEVWRARDPQRGEVALKILRLDHAEDAEIRGRFRREIRHCLALRHPRVLRAFDTGDCGGLLWFSCELAEGGTLRDRLTRQGRLPASEMVPIGCEILEGLEGIAGAGLVHRDLKPGNVLFFPDGARIGDLGMSRALGGDSTCYTGTGMVVGTPAYFAPEWLNGTPPDIRGDLYSFGVLLFECLSGHPPFQADTHVELMRLHLESKPPRLLDLAPEAGRELSDLVSELLTKDPARRPDDPGAIRRRLESLKGQRAFPATLPEKSFPATITETSFPATIQDGPTAGIAPTCACQGPERTLSGRTLPGTTCTGGLHRARIDLAGPDRAWRLFAYAADRLRWGRDNLDRPDLDVCLRLLPSRLHADATRRISSLHFATRAGAGGWLVEDLGSRHGTRHQDRTLPPDRPAALAPGDRIEVAEVLVLACQPLPGPGGGGLLLLRQANQEDHAYLQVVGEACLAPDGRGSGQAWRLRRNDGGLEIAASDGPWRPLLPDLVLHQPPWTLRVAPLAAEDQK